MTSFETLALRVPHQPDEPPPYFAARLAARNGRPARMFAPDMGLSMQRLADGCEADVRKLADLGGADYKALIGCALRKKDGIFLLKGQQLKKTGLRRTRLHVCPRCLLEDVATSDLPPHLAIFGRVSWGLLSIRTCPIHEIALVEVARGMPVHDTHDWTANIAPAIPKLRELAESAIHHPPSALEFYVLDRLAGRPTDSWLDAFPLFAATHVAELLGAVAVSGPRVNLDKLSEDARKEAGDAGAKIANGGKTAIVELMSNLKKAYLLKRAGTADTAQGVFGRLYTVPSQGMSDPAYEPLREVMGEFISENFALGTGDVLFGKPVARRRLHSIRSASVEYNLTPKRLRKILQAEGLVSDPNSHDRDIVFDAHHADRIFRREQESLSVLQVEQHLNASRIQTKVLIEAGFIKRHTSGARMYEYCLRSEVDELLSRLCASTVPVTSTPVDAANIATAAKRAYCSMAVIVQAILDCKLAWVGRLESATGFASLLVNIEEVKACTKLDDLPGLPLNAAARQVLKTNYRVLDQLTNIGALKVTSAINPVNRAPTRIIEFAEIERFQSEYVSLYHLARSRGLHMPALKKGLLAKGINPVDFEGVKATFYRRADVETMDGPEQLIAENSDSVAAE
jgi:hypothetical protein